MKLAINCLLDNCYFTLGDICFLQLIGISIGSDPTPFMTNLLWKEVTSSNNKLEVQKARIFSNIFRFLDNLCTFNKNEFEKNFNGIYFYHRIKDKNKNPCEASFSYLSVEVNDRKCTTELFDNNYNVAMDPQC